METEENYPAQFKNVIEKIIDAELNKRGIPKYISALVKGVNDNGTVNVCIPPNLDSIISGLLNKTGETLSEGDSVELCAKNGSVNNSWVAIKHKTSTQFAGVNTPNTFTQDQTFNGQLNLSNFNRIYWKEPGYGDKFAIVPQFGGTGDDNYLSIMASVGDAGTDPSLYDIVKFKAQTGAAWLKGQFNTDSNVVANGNVVANSFMWANGQRVPVFNGWCADANNALYEGRYYTSYGCLNIPGSTPWGCIRVRVSNGDTINHIDNWGWQEYFSTSGRKWIRYIVNNSDWSTWKEITTQRILYDNTSGTNANLTLNDSAANYDSIEIFFRDNDNNYNSVKVCNPNGKNVTLISQYNNGNNTVWFKIAIVTISGNSITFGNREEVKLINGSSPSISFSSNIYITRVVGY